MKTRILSAILATLMVVSMIALPVSAETIATADGSLVGTVYAPTTNLSWNDPYNDVTRATDDDLNTQWKCVGQNSYTAKTQYFGYYYAGGAVIDSVSFKVGGYRAYSETATFGGIRLEVSTDKTNWNTIWEDKEGAYKDQVVTVDASNWDATVMTDGAVWNYVRVAYGNESGYCDWDMLQVYDFRVSGEYVVPADAIVTANKFENPLSAPFGVRTNILEAPYVVGTDGLNSIGFILKVEGLGEDTAVMYGIDPVISQTVTTTSEQQKVDEAGELVFDADGAPVMETVEVEEVRTYSLGWHGNWVWGSCNKGTFNGDGYYMYTVPFNALANDLSMTSKAGDTTISQFNVFRSDMAFNVLGVSEVKEGVTVSLVGICETSVPAGSAFIKDADGTTLLGIGSTAAALDTTWASGSGAKWAKITTIDSIYSGNGAAPVGYGIDKYVDANGNEYAPDDYILGTVNLTAVYGERDVVKYTATVSELVNGQEATVTVKVDDPAVVSTGKVTVAVDSTAFECENNVIEYTEIAEDGTIGTITIKVKNIAPSGEYTFALTAEATSAKGDVIPSYEDAVVDFKSTQQEGLFFEGDVVAFNKTQVAEDGTVTAPGQQKLWGGKVDTTVDGAGADAITFIFKLDGITTPIIADAFNFTYNNSGWTWNSWNWQNTGNTGGKCCANLTFEENGYFYMNVNNIPNGGAKYTYVNDFQIFCPYTSAGCDSSDRTNTNENATFQMLGVVANNLTPTVKFVNADGSELATYTHAYTNYSGNRWAWYDMGKILSAEEAYAKTGAAAPTMADNADGSPNIFVGWVDADGNPVEAIYYNQTLYASYTSAYVEYAPEVVVDGNEATLIITGNGPALENVTTGTIDVAIDENVFASDLAVDGVISVDFDLTPEVEVPEEGVEAAALDTDILATIVLTIKKPVVSGEYAIAISGTAKDAEGNDIYVKSTTATIAVEDQDVTGAFVAGDKVVINSAAEGSAPATQTVWQGNVNLGGADVATFVFKIEGAETAMDFTQFAPIVNGAHTLGINGNTWLWDNHWGHDQDDNGDGIYEGGFAAGMKIPEDGIYYVSLGRRYIANDGSTKYNTVNGFKLFQTPNVMHNDVALDNFSATNTNENATFEMLGIFADDLTPTVNFYNGDELVGTYEYEYSALTGYADGKWANKKMKSFGALASAADIFEASALETPSKASDDQYVYVFKGWVDAEGNPVDAVYYDMDVYAQYEATEKTTAMEIPFYNGEELFGTDEVYENETANAPEGTPEKAENATGKFVFKGWATTEGGEVVDLSKYVVTEPVSFYAVYEYVDVTFEVTYVGYNGATIYTETVVRSTDAAYDVVPTKPTDAYNEEMGGGYKYAFSFWGVESVNEETGEVSYVAADLTNVQGDIKVYAQFDASLVEEWFTVTFVDKDETVLSEKIVATGEGVTTSVKGNYNGKADENYWYTFDGWDKDTSVVTEDMTVTIVYTTTPVATGANTVIAEGSGTVGTENALVSSDYTYTAPSGFLTLIFDIKGATTENPISIGAIRTQAKNGSDTIDSNNSGNYGKDSVALKEITEDGLYYVTIGHYVMTWVGSDWEIIKSLTIDDDGATRGGKSAGNGTYDVTAIEGKLEPTVRYYDAEGNWLYTGKHTVNADQWTFRGAKVPTAADIYKGAEIENFEAWVDADGNEVTYVTENMSVYAKTSHVHKYVAVGQGTAECECGDIISGAFTLVAAPAVSPGIKAGDEIRVSVMLDNGALTGVTFDVTVTGDATLQGIDVTGTPFDGYTAEYADGRVVLNAAMGGADIDPEDGYQIVDLVLIADKDMTAEDIVTVKVDLVQAVNIANEDITDEIYSGYVSEQTFEVTVVEPEILWGDVNGDGAIDGTDAMLLNRYTSGWGEADYADADALMSAGDINDDGAIDGTDAMLLNRYTSGWGEDDYADAVNLIEALATLG